MKEAAVPSRRWPDSVLDQHSSSFFRSHAQLRSMSTLLGLPLVVLTGACCSRSGKDALGIGAPTGAGVGPLADDERGVRVVVGKKVRLQRGQIDRSSFCPR